MGGEKGGRRNTGYWEKFNNWWREHLAQRNERPRAEHLKKWFNEESRRAFPHDPPTYTMIRNHAKGLRDKQSVKHYFRDYRARKRRAYEDLEGQPSAKLAGAEGADADGGGEGEDVGAGNATPPAVVRRTRGVGGRSGSSVSDSGSSTEEDEEDDDGVSSDEDWSSEGGPKRCQSRRRPPQPHAQQSLKRQRSQRSQQQQRQHEQKPAKEESEQQQRGLHGSEAATAAQQPQMGQEAGEGEEEEGEEQEGDLTVTVRLTGGAGQYKDGERLRQQQQQQQQQRQQSPSTPVLAQLPFPKRLLHQNLREQGQEQGQEQQEQRLEQGQRQQLTLKQEEEEAAPADARALQPAGADTHCSPTRAIHTVCTGAAGGPSHTKADEPASPSHVVFAARTSTPTDGACPDSWRRMSHLEEQSAVATPAAAAGRSNPFASAVAAADEAVAQTVNNTREHTRTQPQTRTRTHAPDRDALFVGLHGGSGSGALSEFTGSVPLGGGGECGGSCAAPAVHSPPGDASLVAARAAAAVGVTAAEAAAPPSTAAGGNGSHSSQGWTPFAIPVPGAAGGSGGGRLAGAVTEARQSATAGAVDHAMTASLPSSEAAPAASGTAMLELFVGNAAAAGRVSSSLSMGAVEMVAAATRASPPATFATLATLPPSPALHHPRPSTPTHSPQQHQQHQQQPQEQQQQQQEQQHAHISSPPSENAPRAPWLHPGHHQHLLSLAAAGRYGSGPPVLASFATPGSPGGTGEGRGADKGSPRCGAVLSVPAADQVLAGRQMSLPNLPFGCGVAGGGAAAAAAAQPSSPARSSSFHRNSLPPGMHESQLHQLHQQQQQQQQQARNIPGPPPVTTGFAPSRGPRPGAVSAGSGPQHLLPTSTAAANVAVAASPRGGAGGASPRGGLALLRPPLPPLGPAPSSSLSGHSVQTGLGAAAAHSPSSAEQADPGAAAAELTTFGGGDDGADGGGFAPREEYSGSPQAGLHDPFGWGGGAAAAAAGWPPGSLPHRPAPPGFAAPYASRARWYPYPHHAQWSAWYPYGYPLPPAARSGAAAGDGADAPLAVRPGMPYPYMPYAVARRRFMSAPSHLQQYQQHQQYYGGGGGPMPMPLPPHGGIGGGASGGFMSRLAGRPPPPAGSRAAAMELLGEDPWVTHGYEDSRPAGMAPLEGTYGGQYGIPPPHPGYAMTTGSEGEFRHFGGGAPVMAGPATASSGHGGGSDGGGGGGSHMMPPPAVAVAASGDGVGGGGGACLIDDLWAMCPTDEDSLCLYHNE